MAVKIRMKRMGSRKRPFFRVVAADMRSPRDGRFIEVLGYYNPMVDPPDIKFDEDKVYKWLNVGAELSGNVAQLLKKMGLLERWQLLKQGVKVSELDAKIAERREKQPKPMNKEERETVKKDAGAEKAEASSESKRADASGEGEQKADAAADNEQPPAGDAEKE